MKMTTEQKIATAKLANVKVFTHEMPDGTVKVFEEYAGVEWNPETNAAQLMELVEAMKDKCYIHFETNGGPSWIVDLWVGGKRIDEFSRPTLRAAILAALLQLPELAGGEG